jgi:hypothetical protein
VHVPELVFGALSRCLLRQAGRDERLHSFLEMKAELVVDIGRYIVAPETEIAAPFRFTHSS